MNRHKMPSRRHHLPPLNPPQREDARRIEGLAQILIVTGIAAVLGTVLAMQIDAMFTAHIAAIFGNR